MDHKVKRGERTIDLTVKEFALLEYLLLHHTECVTRSQLMKDVWKMSPDAGTNVVDVYINYLRRKLAAGEPEDADSLIETVRGSGYKLAGVGRKSVGSVDGLEASRADTGA
jgi:DNA-binding response OmpR family regulator